MEPEEWDMPGVSKQLIMNFNHFHMELQPISSDCCLDSQYFHSGGELTAGANVDSQWMELDAGGIAYLSKQSLMTYKRFQMVR